MEVKDRIYTKSPKVERRSPGVQKKAFVYVPVGAAYYEDPSRIAPDQLSPRKGTGHKRLEENPDGRYFPPSPLSGPEDVNRVVIDGRGAFVRVVVDEAGGNTTTRWVKEEPRKSIRVKRARF